jgi:hypothetical protein
MPDRLGVGTDRRRTLMINVINGWNRIAVGLFADPAAAKSVAAAAAA